MRVTLTGASGVGKTTLAELLSAELSLPLIPELARVVCKETGYRRIGDIPDQEAFKLAVLERQLAEEERLNRFVADRSAIDCWVLWQRWNICSAMTYDSEKLYNRCRDQSTKYSHVVYIPPLFEPVEDEFRWTDPDYIRQLDRITRMTLYELGLIERTFTVTSITIEERLAEVMNWLK